MGAQDKRVQQVGSCIHALPLPRNNLLFRAIPGMPLIAPRPRKATAAAAAVSSTSPVPPLCAGEQSAPLTLVARVHLSKLPCVCGASSPTPARAARSHQRGRPPTAHRVAKRTRLVADKALMKTQTRQAPRVARAVESPSEGTKSLFGSRPFADMFLHGGTQNVSVCSGEVTDG